MWMRRAKCRTPLRKALKDDTLQLPEPFQAQLPQVKEVLRKLAGKLDIKNADERRPIKTRQAVLHSEEFQALWDRIKHKTTYRVQFDNEKLVTDCAEAIGKCPPITKTRVQIRKADLAIGRGGVLSEETTVAAPIIIEETDIELPDLLTDLQDKTQLTRRSLVRILTDSDRLDDFKRNPQQFIELADRVHQPHQAARPCGRHPVSAHRRRGVLRPGTLRAGGADWLPQEHAGLATSPFTNRSSTTRPASSAPLPSNWKRTKP